MTEEISEDVQEWDGVTPILVWIPPQEQALP